jgi:hypothetical protein
MHIDDVPPVLGLTRRQVRDGLRAASRGFDWSIEAFAEAVGLSRDARVADALLAAGLIELDEDASLARRGERWSLTKLGVRVRNANAARRVRLERAREMAAATVLRALAINASADFSVQVVGFGLFGSVRAGAELCSDVDMVYELRRRGNSEAEQRETAAAARQRASAQGRRFSNVSQEMCWPEDEALLALRAGSAYVNLHPLDDVQRLDGVAVEWLIMAASLTASGAAFLDSHRPKAKEEAARAVRQTRRKALRARLNAVSLDTPVVHRYTLIESIEPRRLTMEEQRSALQAEDRFPAGTEFLPVDSDETDVLEFDVREPSTVRGLCEMYGWDVCAEDSSCASDLLSAISLPDTPDLRAAARRRLRSLLHQYWDETSAAAAPPEEDKPDQS